MGTDRDVQADVGSGSGWIVSGCVLAAVLIGLGARAAIAVIASDLLRDDATFYVASAHDLAAGRGYLLHGLPTAYWPVGYPALLALVFKVFPSGLVAVRWAQIGIALASIVAASAIARRLYNRSSSTCLVAFLMALSPGQVTYPSVMLSEVAFTGFALAGSVCVIGQPRWGLTLLGGLCWAVATFIRPVALLLPVVLILWGMTATPARKVLLGTVIYAVIALACLPWMIRNQRVLGHPVLVSTNGGINLWMGNHEGATGAYRFTPLMEVHSMRTKNEVEFDRYAREQAWQYVRNHPDQFLGLAARKTILLWSPDHTGPNAVIPVDTPRVFTRLCDFFHWGVVLVLAYAIVSRRAGLRLPLAVLIYFTLVHAVSVASPRYLFPAEPLLIIGAASVFVPRGEDPRQGQRKRLCASSSSPRQTGPALNGGESW